MPPPSWIPPAAASNDLSQASEKLSTPLASLVPPSLAGKDVREWFPKFRRGEVRFGYPLLRTKIHALIISLCFSLVISSEGPSLFTSFQTTTQTEYLEAKKEAERSERGKD